MSARIGLVCGVRLMIGAESALISAETYVTMAWWNLIYKDGR